MAKTFVEDSEDQTRIPFLRGILIRSLQDSGVIFDKASSIASDIRNDLAETTLLTNADLSQIVLKYLRELGDDSITGRYENRHMPLVIQVEHRDGQVAPFSRFEFRHILETIGLKPGDSDKIVHVLQEHLSNRYLETIKYNHLAMLVYRYLRQSSTLGPAVAHRWLVWHDFINSGRGLIFLIGGTAGCGKSTTANTLASRLEIVRTQSTDMLREVMRTMIPKQLMPVLHYSSFTAWKGLPEQPQNNEPVSEAQLVQGYRSQADILSLAIEAVVGRATREHVSLVLEGVHIHPAFMEKLQTETDVVVIPIMLGLLKRKHLQERIRKRSTNVPDRGAEHYLQHFDEIWRLQSYLLSEADGANIHIAVNESRAKIFTEIMLFTIATLAENFDSTPEKVFAESASLDQKD
jgi:2-phosphoglycerate kinase